MVLLNLGESITQHRNSAANQQSGPLQASQSLKMYHFPSQTSASDVFSPAKIFSRKLLASQLLPVTSVVEDLPRQVVFDSFDHQHGQTSGRFPTPVIFDAAVRCRCHWLRNVFEKRDGRFPRHGSSTSATLRRFPVKGASGSRRLWECST